MVGPPSVKNGWRPSLFSRSNTREKTFKPFKNRLPSKATARGKRQGECSGAPCGEANGTQSPRGGHSCPGRLDAHGLRPFSEKEQRDLSGIRTKGFQGKSVSCLGKNDAEGEKGKHGHFPVTRVLDSRR